MSLNLTQKRLSSALFYGLTFDRNGGRPWLTFSWAFLLPVALGVVAWYGALNLAGSVAFTGATMLTAASMAVLGLTFTRVKDSVVLPRPDVGPDPVERAYRAFRIAFSASIVALALAVLLLVVAVVPLSGCIAIALSAVSVTLLSHLVVRLLLVLRALRQQVELMVTDRAVPPLPPQPHKLASVVGKR
jgi:hypothetical protein